MLPQQQPQLSTEPGAHRTDTHNTLFPTEPGAHRTDPLNNHEAAGPRCSSSVAENTTVAADVLSRICHGLAPAAPAIGGVLLYVLTNNNKASRRHTAMYRTAAVTGTATATRRLQRQLRLLFSSGRCCVDCFRLLLLLPLLLPVRG